MGASFNINKTCYIKLEDRTVTVQVQTAAEKKTSSLKLTTNMQNAQARSFDLPS